MIETIIYGSSGNMRYPTGTEPVSHDDKEAIRNLFFDSAYFIYEEQSIQLFFEAHTGSPEQFVGECQGVSKHNAVQVGYESINDCAKQELEWSIPDKDASDGHHLFRLIPEVDSYGPSQYSSQLIGQTGVDSSLDFGVPDLETAVGFFKWLTQEVQPDLSVAIGGDGRTRSLSHIDILIIPNHTETKVRGINGSHELLSESFTDNIVERTVSILNQHSQRPQISDGIEATKAVVDGINNGPLRVGEYDFAALTPQEFLSQKEMHAKLSAIITGILAFGVTFIISGGLTSITQWWGETILSGGQVQSPTISVIASAIDVASPGLSASGLIFFTGIFALGWVGVSLYGLLHFIIGRGHSAKQAQTEWHLSERQHQEMASVVDTVTTSELCGMNEFLTKLSNNAHYLDVDVVVQSNKSMYVSTLPWIVGAIVLAATALGGVGYLVGSYIPAVLQQWLVVADVVIFISGISLLCLLGVWFINQL